MTTTSNDINGRDIALRCPRPRSSGRNPLIAPNALDCSAERGADGAARHPYLLVPKGPRDNSPAFQCRELSRISRVPKGRLIGGKFNPTFGTWDYPHTNPALKCRAIVVPSRDENGLRVSRAIRYLCFLFAFTFLTTSSLFAADSRNAASPVTLHDFKLVGDLSNNQAAFTLTATAEVESSAGGSIEMLSGAVALTKMGAHPKWSLPIDGDRYTLKFPHRGSFPIELKFSAAVHQRDGWNDLEFRVAPAAPQPIVLRGVAADTQFQFPGGARPEHTGGDFTSYLPSDGAVRLSWKEVRPEAEGKLFYAAEMLSQIAISPGLMRQTARLDFKVMQGETSRVVLLVRGTGEVTRVQGAQVLAWNVEPGTNAEDRRLVVQLNEAQKDQFALQIQTLTPLGAFPQTAEAVQLRPEGATRFAGYFRIVNDGAVRLEVTQASGLSQISPEQFPETDATKALFSATGSQRFAYRFSGPDFGLRIQTDQVLPELSVSEVLAYRLGESELDIDAEIELDIREAPLRELVLRVPKGYSISKLTVPGLNDYFLREPDGETNAELRLIYGQPATGRQVVELRLERNLSLGATNWMLPRIEVTRAKSVRGHIGVAADVGFRLTPERTQALTEIATAFFPAKLPGIQSAFRLTDPAWEAVLRVERLPQTVQADVLHLFSVGEGVAYGSSVMNYVVSGVPVAAFRVALSDEYFNVEFTGKDIRGWSKTNDGYLVQLHTPVSGPYTLLATYERPFKARGETLSFTGAQPLDAQSEQGYTLVVSAYQFQVKPADISPGLLPLEPGEVPAEYRLFFDAPILAAYRYMSRPFNLKLALSPLAQGDSLSQVVDRATLGTHISKEGQVLTDARYFIKNRGNPHFRLTIPNGTQLWSAAVNGTPVVPVIDGNADLIPLPQRADPDAVLTLDLKMASRAPDPNHLTIAAPVLDAPVMVAEWKMDPDAGQHLEFYKGTLAPEGGVPDSSGFAVMARVFSGSEKDHAVFLTIIALFLVGIAALVWRWTGQPNVSRFSARHLAGTMIGLVAFAFAISAMLQLVGMTDRAKVVAPRNLTFLAPVQQAGGALTVEVGNLAANSRAFNVTSIALPIALALGVWLLGWFLRGKWIAPICVIVGWAVLVWGELWQSDGALISVVAGLAFVLLHVAIPGLRQLARAPRKPKLTPPAPAGGGAPAVAAWLIGGFILLGLGSANVHAGNKEAKPAKDHMAVVAEVPDIESVNQQVRVEEKFVLATAKIHWQALKGQTLPILYTPAVLTHLIYPKRALELQEPSADSGVAEQLFAKENGAFDVEVQYQVDVSKRDNDSGFKLPTPCGLVNQLQLSITNLEVDVFSPEAVSVQRDETGSSTVARLVFRPRLGAWIGWHPRSRDLRREKSVFYAEIHQLYVPGAGVVEGAHFVNIRPAQGELDELTFNVPAGAAVTDVIALGTTAEGNNAAAGGVVVSLWRFDPDTHKLRVNLRTPQSKPFTLLVRSQVATGPLPFEKSVGLLEVENAAGQIGLLGIATGNEVQLDSVTAGDLSAINLEDYPATALTPLQATIPGLTLRRAFRYSDVKATASLKASAVEPDVRVETQSTLSLGEDRTVLAANSQVEITRAGIFSLSFALPAGMDVESVSGAALSHWSESKLDTNQIITLHLKGKTEGQQQFALTLTGPGLKSATSWAAPQLVFREAGKQNGSLVIVPEQGMRLQAGARDGLTQVDPQKSGIRQKGVLAFRILQTPWSLTLDIDQVDPWIQVTSLQQATVSEAQVKVAANLQYQIENTGLKAFRIFLPTNAQNVHFQGDQIADFLAVANDATNEFQPWEIKLHRRVIGSYLLQVTYQTVMPEQAAETVLRGVRAGDVNLQRGFVTVQSSGRLELRVDSPPAALQPAEWQSIPRTLQQDLPAASASFAYRLVEPTFQLPLKIDRHEAAKLLPARVNNIAFTSVISDAGIMLTQVRLELQPGDKRMLYLTLPNNSQFWFAFVNQNGVWPWRDQDRILIPLDQQTRDTAVPVEIFYISKAGASGGGALDLDLLAPKFDLPLENITWHVYLNDKWKVKNWSGSLQLQQQQVLLPSGTDETVAYLQNEASAQREKTKEAGEMLAMGNSLLQKGDPQQARRAFSAAYGLSQGDDAFNEDARVQLNNLKLQQALVGLNVRQSAANADGGGLGGKLRDLHGKKELAYTQQDAKDIIDRNTADENTALMRLAERLIQQQDAAVSSPAAIRASIPAQGRELTFTRAVLVDPWADLRIHVDAFSTKTKSFGGRLLAFVAVLVVLGLIARASRSLRRPQPGI